MRLIDKDKLLHQGYDYVVDGIAYDSCNKSMDIEDIPTVQAVSIDKVKEAREKIWEKVQEYSGSGNEVTQAYCDGFKDSLAILDKLIEESEIE